MLKMLHIKSGHLKYLSDLRFLMKLLLSSQQIIKENKYHPINQMILMMSVADNYIYFQIQ